MPNFLRCKRTSTLAVGAVVLTAFVAGIVVGRRNGDGHGHHAMGHREKTAAGEQQAQVWTCSMHPRIQQPDPGKCPICAMDLIPLTGDSGDDLGPRELKLSAAARELARIQVEPAARLLVHREVRMVGAVDYDETRLATISAWVGGRLDRLFVDYTGIAVKEGDHMVWMYSPDVLAAQEELIQARKAVAAIGGAPGSLVRSTAEAMLAAARDKLRLWGLTPEQIEEIERRGSAADHIQINAPTGGIVIHKNAVEGDYVKTGTPIYRIADLSQVWIRLDAYESDLPWLRYGQEVTFAAEGQPGREFSGRIAFIDPLLTQRTRTVKIRLNVPNEDGALKPGMFVRATVRAQVTAAGKVVAPDLAGKWISPMHPEIVKDGPGNCDVCGMPLVKAEELGSVAPSSAAEAPLVIPASAPLITGRRAVVYVQDPDDESRFAGREIVLGPRTEAHYVVDSGLEEGELVVVNGNFKIDSALQIVAKPSMMTPAGGTMGAGHHHGGDMPTAAPMTNKPERIEAPPASAGAGEAYPGLPQAFTEQFGAVLDAYLSTQRALSQDKVDEAKAAAGQIVAALDRVDMALLPHEPHMAWMPVLGELNKAAGLVVRGEDIAASREGFAVLSESMASAVRRFGTGLKRGIVQVRCPMAFNDRGASWLQSHTEVENPYFGATMFRCGEVTDTLINDSAEQEEGHHHE